MVFRSMMARFPMNKYIACVFLLAAGALLAQHEYTAADIENGGRQYVNNCVYCHGPEGDQIAGVSLLQGKFKRAVSGRRYPVLADYPQRRPGAGMPASGQTNMNESNARTIVAYLRSATQGPATHAQHGGNARAPASRSSKAKANAPPAIECKAAARGWARI